MTADDTTLSDDEASTLDAVIHPRPPDDPLPLALARARVARALFAQLPDPVKIGAFHVLERIGRGGMGTVYAAYDPDLDRRVALKLVPVTDRTTRERLLAEAQALARLSHPNSCPCLASRSSAIRSAS